MRAVEYAGGTREREQVKQQFGSYPAYAKIEPITAGQEGVGGVAGNVQKSKRRQVGRRESSLDRETVGVVQGLLKSMRPIEKILFLSGTLIKAGSRKKRNMIMPVIMGKGPSWLKEGQSLVTSMPKPSISETPKSTSESEQADKEAKEKPPSDKPEK
jgi:hypothetical protein